MFGHLAGHRFIPVYKQEFTPPRQCRKNNSSRMSKQSGIRLQDITLRNQQTIDSAVSVSGFGYWNGQDIELEFRPAEENSGVVFVRSDLPGNPRIPARVENRVEVPRRTNLIHRGQSVEMVEHVLAALYALKIDNCEVHVTGAEMPGMDGSSLAFVEALQSVGTIKQDAYRSLLVVADAVRVGNEDAWVQARPTKKPRLKFKYKLDYGSGSIIGRETLEAVFTTDYFVEQLASARTFILEEEAKWLQSQGLGKRVTYQDLVVFGEEGPIDNELRFEDECVRHKSLDLIGDLSLAGCDLFGKVHAFRSGHRLNADLVKQLLHENQVIQSDEKRPRLSA